MKHQISDQTEQRQKKLLKPPRHRMRGGDTPRGGRSHGIGHAGLANSAHLLGLIAFLVLQLVGAVSPLCTRRAYADETITFSNGGTATKQGNGCIVGNCYLRASWNGDYYATFITTMPDGQQLPSHCIDDSLMVPANGTYTFAATPHASGGYDVIVASNFAEQYQDAQGNLSPGYSAGSQIQRTRCDNPWTPLFATTPTSGSTTNPTNPSPNANPDSDPDPSKGRLWLVKSPSKSIPSLADLYSLAGARYGIYKDSACTKQVAGYELVTKENGESNVISIDSGNYWVKEITPPAGFSKDLTSHLAIVAPDATEKVKVTDDPLYFTPQVWAKKRDADLFAVSGSNAAQGDSTLAGAEFEVCCFPGEHVDTSQTTPRFTWIMATNEDGDLIPRDDLKISGDPFLMVNDLPVLPYGVITIKETKAPNGYLLDDQTSDVRTISINANEEYDPPVFLDHVARGGVHVLKRDATEKQAIPQGEATLSQASFSIVLASDNSVVVDGVMHQKGSVVKEIKTDESGVAETTSNALPFGTYEIRETTAPNGYTLNEEYSRSFSITKNGEVRDLTNDPCDDQVIGGKVSIKKTSCEVPTDATEGIALKGAKFLVKNAAGKDVRIGGQVYAPNDTVLELKSNADGVASSSPGSLPYGTYVITEAEAPKGYVLDDDWSKAFTIDETNTDHMVVAQNRVARGGFQFVKVEERNRRPLSGIPFLITNKDTQESHLIVSDQNGLVDTESVPHTSNTNANDEALRSNKTVDVDKLTNDAGIWFGQFGHSPTANDSLGALPYGNYLVEELSCGLNRAFDLAVFDVTIDKDGITSDLGTIVNQYKPEPEISTNLVFGDDEHVSPVGEQVKLVDTVSLNGLEEGVSYAVEGRLMDKATLGQSNDPIATASTKFTAEDAHESVEVVFDVDTTELSGKSLVCYEALKMDGSDEIIVSHEDPQDESQTMHVPSISTTLTDQNGMHQVTGESTVLLVDKVSYQNLMPHSTYQLEGTLMDKQTNRPIKGADGTDIHKSVVFTTQDADGTAEVKFEVPIDLVAGKDIVAFERLSKNDIVLVAHENLKDVAQTVSIRRPTSTPEAKSTSTPKSGTTKNDTKKSGSTTSEPEKSNTEKSDKGTKDTTSSKADDSQKDETKKSPRTGDSSMPFIGFVFVGTLVSLVGIAKLTR